MYEPLPAIAVELLEQFRRSAPAVPVSASQARAMSMLASSYTRLGLLLELYFCMRRRDWFRALGAEWSQCDNIAQYREHLLLVFRLATDAQLRSMMSAPTRRRWDALPNTITVYRGCYRGVNEAGLSWTLSRERAAGFPFLRRYSVEGAEPVLLTAQIPKARTVLVTNRNEEELILTGVEYVSPDYEPLTRPD